MTGKTVLIFGMARSGVAAAQLLAKAGAMVRVADRKTKSELGEAVAPLSGLCNIDWRLGEPAEMLLGGVDLMVLSPGIPEDHPAVLEARLRKIPVMGEIELSYRFARGKIVAITGTNGKTTTTSLVGEIFKNAGKQTYVVGNIGDPFSAVAADTADEDIIVCEVSSFQLETVEKFHPFIAVILNITEDHLDRHGSMERYAALKARVFENQALGDALVLNYDDPALRQMIDLTKSQVVWFSRTQVPPYGAYVKDDFIVFGSPGEERQICEAHEVRIPGPHNLENALAAAAIAMIAEIPPPVIRHSLRTFKGVEHRLELVRDLNGVRFINDSKGTNADSTVKAVDSMDRPTAIILGGYDKHVDFASLCKRIADNPYIRHAVLIGATASQFERQLAEAGFTAVRSAGEDFEAAIKMAYSLVRPGGCVLLSPASASFGMFADFEQRGAEYKRIVMAMTDGA